jgi:hypothetical protein
MRIHNCIAEEEKNKVVGEITYRTSVIENIVKKMYDAGKNEIMGWLFGSRNGDNFHIKEVYIQPKAGDKYHIQIDKEYLISILKNQRKGNCLVGCFHTHVMPPLTVISPCFYLREINEDDREAQIRLQKVYQGFMSAFLLDGETLHSKGYRINEMGENEYFRTRKR